MKLTTKEPRKGDVRIQFSETNRILTITKLRGYKESTDIIYIDNHYVKVAKTLKFR